MREYPLDTLGRNPLCPIIMMLIFYIKSLLDVLDISIDLISHVFQTILRVIEFNMNFSGMRITYFIYGHLVEVAVNHWFKDIKPRKHGYRVQRSRTTGIRLPCWMERVAFIMACAIKVNVILLLDLWDHTCHQYLRIGCWTSYSNYSVPTALSPWLILLHSLLISPNWTELHRYRIYFCGFVSSVKIIQNMIHQELVVFQHITSKI